MKIEFPSPADLYREKNTERLNTYYYSLVKDKENNTMYKGKTLSELKYMFALIYKGEKNAGLLSNCLFTTTVDEFIRLLHDDEKIWLEQMIEEERSFEIQEQLCWHPLPM